MYSASPLLLSTSATLLAGDRVFVGNQPDDFAVGPLAGPADTVCVLGLGYGGSLRPLLAASPASRITAVDLDPDMVTVTRALFRQHFPGTDFRTQVADASVFLEGSERYDLVVIDIYAGESYPDFVLTEPFWRGVRGAVAPGGTALLNAWGLPEHLRPLTPPSPQHLLAGLLTPLWPHATYLSCRRNMTVVLRDTREDDPAETLRGAEAGRGTRLSPVDEAVLALQRLRLVRAADFRVPADAPAGDTGRAVPRTPEQLDAEMARRWPEMLAEVRAHADAAGADASVVGSREFYRRREVAVPTTLELARHGHPAAALLPNVAAALTFGGDTSLGWYGDWIADEAESLAAEYPEWLTRTALAQALAMAANPLVPEWPWTDRLLKRTSAVTAAS
ncbi:spermidine synthase [Streptomyces albus]|uniref:spermidine synthase n=1 Tax=Streptomyces albus TaxID=1888 RepID=UPI0004C524D4|nr:methyltransferase domain-containing protein [Streptomyces albus]